MCECACAFVCVRVCCCVCLCACVCVCECGLNCEEEEGFNDIVTRIFREGSRVFHMTTVSWICKLVFATMKLLPMDHHFIGNAIFI
jgi:hypothetical protein